MTTPIEELRWRIYNVFPAGELALDHLLSLFSISYSSRVPTAGVKAGIPPLLVFNPVFVEERCRGDEHLVALLMHEMHHLVLGHTRLFPLVTPAHNFAFDALINAMVCRSMPGYEYTSFFTTLYSDEGVEALLRPPELWAAGQGASARWKLKGALLEVHKALYSEEGDLTYQDIFDLVVERVNREAAVKVRLLGSHGQGLGEEGPDDPGVVKALAEIVGRWPAFDKTMGRDRGAGLAKQILGLTAPDLSVSRTIRKAIARVAEQGRGSQRINCPVQRETLLPYPTLPDRKASVMESLGQAPVFFRGHAVGNARKTVGEVHVYIDVSGSMQAFIRTLLSSLKPIRKWLHPVLHAFSTEVADCPARDILQGRFQSDGGTDIDCVLEHLIRNRIRKAAIVTDGFVGKPSDLLIGKLPRQLRLVKLLTPEYHEDDLRALPGPLHRLQIEEV